MSKRKTITVESFKVKINKMIADSPDSMTEARTALAGLLESVLFETDNYHGFNYLPGVVDFTVDPPDIHGDETRKKYY